MIIKKSQTCQGKAAFLFLDEVQPLSQNCGKDASKIWRIDLVHSLNKGKNGEREWAHWLNENLGCQARRGRQFSGSPDSPDVVDAAIPGIQAEVKRVESLNIHQAMAQAVKDSGAKIGYVAHRRNRGEWMITLRASDLKSFVVLVHAHLRATP